MSEADQENKVMLPLDQCRSIRIKVKKKPLDFHFRRITCDDWKRYFQGITNQVVQQGDSRDRIFETESSLLELVDRTLWRVEGYPEGDVGGDRLKNINVRLRLAAGTVLRAVGSGDEVSLEISLTDRILVTLDAPWSVDEHGKMTVYRGLVHRFRHPSIEQLKRFNTETATVRIKGGANYGITSYPSRQAIAMKFYDELIEEVEGYSVNGVPLKEKSDIIREMDGSHKAAAIISIFMDEEEEVALGGTDED